MDLFDRLRRKRAAPPPPDPLAAPDPAPRGGGILGRWRGGTPAPGPAPATASAPAPALPDTVDEATAEDRWEITTQWRRFVHTLKWLAYGGMAAGALVVIGQGYLFASLFGDIHPWLGWAFVGLLSGALLWFVVRPAVRFFRLPAVARPPAADVTNAAITTDAVDARIQYGLTYLKTLARNPALADKRTEIAAAQAGLSRLIASGQKPPQDHAADVAAFEEERILPILHDLDRQVDAYIRKEAFSVGTATALSLNGTVDAFVVLWRNVNMISRIARLYYGRPNLRLSLRIIGDVATAVVLSRVADDVSEMAGETLGGVMNRLGGVVAGPIMDGTVNALMTLKLGYATKRRCRSFEVWTEGRSRQVSREVFDQVRRESGSFVTEFLKLCGGVTGAAWGVAEKAMGVPKSAWSLVQNTIARRTGGPEGEERPAD